MKSRQKAINKLFGHFDKINSNIENELGDSLPSIPDTEKVCYDEIYGSFHTYSADEICDCSEGCKKDLK